MEARQRRYMSPSVQSWAASRRAFFPKGRNERRQDAGLREMLMQQCIASGVILLIALVISFLPFSIMTDLRGGIKLALSQEGSADELLEAAGEITSSYESLRNSIRSIFEDSAPEPAQPPNYPSVGTSTEGGMQTNETTPAVIDTDARIDENVLRSINELYEVIDEEKKQ